MRWVFDVFGLEREMHTLSWEEWVAAPRKHVHITGEGQTSYSPDEHPSYKDAFLGSEDLAENYRALQRVRKGDTHKALIDEEGPIAVLQSVRGMWQKSLLNMEADLFTHG